MKTYKNTIILGIVLVILSCSLLGIKYLKNKKTPESDETPIQQEDITIYEMDNENLIGLTIENKEESFEFKKNDNEWDVTAPAGLKADSSKIASIVSAVNGLSADKIIEESASDLSQYGLVSPLAVVTLQYKDGKSNALQIGNINPTKDGYYAKDSKSNKVYLISTYIAEQFEGVKDKIRDKAMFSINAEDVTSFEMDKKGQPFFKTIKKDNAWELTFPIEANVLSGSITSILEVVANPSVIQVYDTADEEYGLSNPSYAFIIKTDKETVKLLLGKEKVNGSEIYAKLDGEKEVYLIDETAFNFLDKPVERIIETFVYIVNIKDVNKIVLEIDGRVDTYEIKCDPDGDNEKDVFKVNGKDVSALKDKNDKQLFRKYYGTLIGITLKNIEPSAVPSGKSEITFTYYLNDGTQTKIEYIPKDEYSYYAIKNGKYSGLTVDKKKFDEAEGIRETWKELDEAMKK